MASLDRSEGANSGGRLQPAHRILELSVMANVLNPEPESITLNTELETPTLEPATELEQPSYESTSNPETAEVVTPALDADATTEPVAIAAHVETHEEPTPSATAEVPVEHAPAEVVHTAEATEPTVDETAASAEHTTEELSDAAPAIEQSVPVPVATRPAHHPGRPTGDEFGESMDDFSAALEAFEREQAAEAAAVEAYGDKVVSGTVIKQTDKHLIVDVGLKSEGMVPLEQVVDHTGAAKFHAGDVIEVVIEREEPEGGYLVSYEKAQRLRVIKKNLKKKEI